MKILPYLFLVSGLAYSVNVSNASDYNVPNYEFDTEGTHTSTSKDYMTIREDFSYGNPPLIHVEYFNTLFVPPDRKEIVKFETSQGDITFLIEHQRGPLPENIQAIEWPPGYVAVIEDHTIPDNTVVDFFFYPYLGS